LRGKELVLAQICGLRHEKAAKCVLELLKKQWSENLL
jgi:hypothetical protein